MTRPLPRRLEGRDPRDGLVQLWRFRWVIVVLLLLAVVALLAVVPNLFEPQTLESGRRQVGVMRKDAVLAFRAPGTALRGQEEQPAREHPFGGGTSTSSIRQVFDMGGEPGDAVEAYGQGARAAGWTFVTDGCSRADRATASVFGKTLDGFDGTLTVRAQLDGSSGGGEQGRRALLVMLEAQQATPSALPVDAGLHRNHVQCLRGLDLSDPDLQPPRLAPPAPGELCGRIPVGAVRAVVPQVGRAEAPPGANGLCWLVDGSGRVLFTVDHADRPRAHYLDRRLPAPRTSEQLLLFSVHGKQDPDLDRAAWLAPGGGPLVVSAGAALPPGRERDALLVAVAVVLARV